MKRGILYIATGRRHLAEMVASVQSVRRHMPDVPIVLYTDQVDLPKGLFTEVRKIEAPRHSFIDKIAPLRETPFKETLFLDTDTYLCAPVYELFELLGRFELALAHAPLRHDRPFVAPAAFCEVNTGVLVYRKTPAVDALFVDWLTLYEREVAETGKMDSDQPAFREALWKSSVAFYVFPAEYNLRTVMPAAVGRYLVRIIHGRSHDMAQLARWVNASRSIRLFLPNALQLTARHFGILSRMGRFVGAFLNLVVAPVVWAERVGRYVKRRLLK